MDGETLLRVINAIIEDIPDICLSKFKMCGGFNEGHQGKPVFPSFWRSMGEEFDLQDDNSTSTNNSTFSSHRMRRHADDQYESEYKSEYEGILILHTIRKVKFLSKNSILTKRQHFNEFFDQIFFDNFSREIKVVNG